MRHRPRLNYHQSGSLYPASVTPLLAHIHAIPRPMSAPSTTLPSPDDPLSETLHTMRMEGTLYCRAELRAPWGIEIPAFEGMMGFMVVTEGHACFQMPGGAAQGLAQGSLTLVPHGSTRWLSDAPGTPARPLGMLQFTPITERYEILQHSGCGRFGADHLRRCAL